MYIYIYKDSSVKRPGVSGVSRFQVFPKKRPNDDDPRLWRRSFTRPPSAAPRRLAIVGEVFC